MGLSHFLTNEQGGEAPLLTVDILEEIFIDLYHKIGPDQHKLVVSKRTYHKIRGAMRYHNQVETLHKRRFKHLTKRQYSRILTGRIVPQ